jgi:hypothetical protein
MDEGVTLRTVIEPANAGDRQAMKLIAEAGERRRVSLPFAGPKECNTPPPLKSKNIQMIRRTVFTQNY